MLTNSCTAELSNKYRGGGAAESEQNYLQFLINYGGKTIEFRSSKKFRPEMARNSELRINSADIYIHTYVYVCMCMYL